MENTSEEILLTNNKNGINFWSDQEHLQYIRFFRDNMEFASDCNIRRTEKIFLQMSKTIPTRSSHQIKSHHQKLMKKHHCVETIL